MQLVSITPLKLKLLFLSLLVSIIGFSQENSPFSRYGMGDVYPSQNILNRAMGGVTSTFSNGLSVNFSNPASYGDIKFGTSPMVVYDLGISIDRRTLVSASPVQKYSSVNFTPSYIALGMTLSKKRNLGLAFGLRQMTRVNYSIEDGKRIAPSDSIYSLYEGDGGLYQAFIGLGKAWKNVRFGFNSGYLFGRKESTTRTIPIDTVTTYSSKSSTTTSMGNVFFNVGLMIDAPLGKGKLLRFGVAGNLKQSLNANQQIHRETFGYNSDGSDITIDSIYQSQEVKGTVKLPMSYTVGISLSDTSGKNNLRFIKSILSLEYESTKWADYRFYDQPDKLRNSWTLRAGWQFSPNPLNVKSYWSRVTYRAGFYFGKEALIADGNNMPVYAFTAGIGLPLRVRTFYETQRTAINTTLEIGKRGNKNNNITESFYRISFGFNLGDLGWFRKPKYD